MMLAARNPVIEGLRVLVIGLGRSGTAAAVLAARRGARVLAVDRRAMEELPEDAARLAERGIEVRTGDHPASLAGETDLVVVSPGVPGDIPLLESCRTRGVPVWGEVELASRYCSGRILGITGSNGKSTTTTMAGSILRAAGIPGGTGGNLDVPLSELLAHDDPAAVHAVELSSFQLESVERFRPAVAVLVNLTPDHLDRYRAFEDYARAKARILEVQEPDDHAVLNADDPETARFEPFVRGREYRFSTRRELSEGAFLREGVLFLRTGYGEEKLLAADSLPVPGEHNVANALAAALACRLCGSPVEGIVEGLRNFRPLPHRLERIAEADGVAFYNDSKATNLDAATRAIRSFPRGTVHLILGGKDKGGDWPTLAPTVREFVRLVLLVGEAAGSIRDGLEGAAPLRDCGTIPEAVRAAFDGARPGDVVLLSPGCASFDQYGNFEERGDDFRRAVSSLHREETGDA